MPNTYAAKTDVSTSRSRDEIESDPDKYGFCHWASYWRTDQAWVPDGVRGQLSRGNLDEELARKAHFGRNVRVIPFGTSDSQPDLFGGLS